MGKPQGDGFESLERHKKRKKKTQGVIALPCPAYTIDESNYFAARWMLQNSIADLLKTHSELIVNPITQLITQSISCSNRIDPLAEILKKVWRVL